MTMCFMQMSFQAIRTCNGFLGNCTPPRVPCVKIDLNSMDGLKTTIGNYKTERSHVSVAVPLK